jgi:hypothetical protein
MMHPPQSCAPGAHGRISLDDLRHHAGTDGTATFADRKAQAFEGGRTGLISVTTILMLSPGITISTPSGKVTAPVMSVVRK